MGDDHDRQRVRRRHTGQRARESSRRVLSLASAAELGEASLLVVEPVLEEADALSEHLVLVSQARDRQREVEQQQQLEPERDREQQ